MSVFGTRSRLLPTSFGSWPEAFDLTTRPLLELALKDSRPAYSPRIEWLVDTFTQGAERPVEHKVWSNYTQILRRAFRPKWLEDEKRLQTMAEAAKESGDQFLDEIETVLWFGKPTRSFYGGHPLTTCGGVLHFLRRRLYENDRVALRCLSEMTLYTSVGPHDFELEPEEHTHEWLWEFSLQVTPGHYQRGLTPLTLAPPKLTAMPKAFAQGASLEQGDMPS